MKTTIKPVEQSIPNRWAKYRRKLLALREHFLAPRPGLVADAERPIDLATHDFADEATDALNHDLAASVLQATDEVLEEIDAALERIENGTYGVCERTGAAIPEQRLMAVPWTRYSAAAEAELERLGKATGLPAPGAKRPKSPRRRGG